MDRVPPDRRPHENPALLDSILSRRSAVTLGPPGPSDEDLERLLAAAVTVPDHGQLRPYRFVIVSGDGRSAFGAALADAALEHKPGLPEAKLEGTRAKAFRSPALIALIASPKPGKIEAWEQHATAACAGYAIVLAAHALGIGAVWKSVPFTRGRSLCELLALGPTEEMLGFIHLGTPVQEEKVERAAFEPSSVATVLDGGTPRPFRR